MTKYSLDDIKKKVDDLAGLRATYCGQLRKQGLTETETEIDK